MKKNILFVCIFVMLSLTACDIGPKSSRGFSLPDGDVIEGQQTFVKLRCNDCHIIKGLDDLNEKRGEPIMTVPLGGKTTRVFTYGELVTSIINPSHKISQKYLATPVEENGQSKMRNYNELMTVEELIDIVAFLQDQYELEPVSRTYYTVY
ncbi:MAG: cytochrome C [Alphaproteobacteria bacterium]|nr:MAG: cytochrome C [Alphaproteobacteria bacterium]